MENFNPRLNFYKYEIDGPFEWVIFIIVISIIFTILSRSSGSKVLSTDFKIKGEKIGYWKIFLNYMDFLRLNKYIVIISLIGAGITFLINLITIPHGKIWLESMDPESLSLIKYKSVFGFFLIGRVLAMIPELFSFGPVSYHGIWWLLAALWLKRKIRYIDSNDTKFFNRLDITLNVIILVAAIALLFSIGFSIYLATGPRIEVDISTYDIVLFMLKFFSVIYALTAIIFFAFFITFICILMLNKNEEISSKIIDSGKAWKAILIILIPCWLWSMQYLLPTTFLSYGLKVLKKPKVILVITEEMSIYKPESIILVMFFYLVIITAHERGNLKKSLKKYWALLEKCPWKILGLPLMAAVLWMPFSIFFNVATIIGLKMAGTSLFALWILPNVIIPPIEYVLFLFYAGYWWMVFNTVYENYLILVGE